MEYNRIHLNSVDSTSSYARREAEKLCCPCIITASCQTNGRGRQGKSFFSPDGTGLYMTLLLEAASEAELITPAAAVAVCKAIEKLTGIKPLIKWVNDIFVNGKKVCGILSECFCINKKTYIAVGIGVNLTTSYFPPELNNAASLGIDCPADKLATMIADGITDYFYAPDNKMILTEYKSRLFIIGKKITYEKNGTVFSATVKDINEKCNLSVQRDDLSFDTLSSGEISIKVN